MERPCCDSCKAAGCLGNAALGSCACDGGCGCPGDMCQCCPDPGSQPQDQGKPAGGGGCCGSGPKPGQTANKPKGGGCCGGGSGAKSTKGGCCGH